VRQLYTDQDEVLFDAARPVILNGIKDVVTRADLADRGLFVTLPSISEARRRQEQELWREFELSRPRLQGALLDAVSHGLRTLPWARLDRLPRMADFAVWATACETALWSPGTFARTYGRNRRAAIDDAIDADPVAACVRELMAERDSWTGSAADAMSRCGGTAAIPQLRSIFLRYARVASIPLISMGFAPDRYWKPLSS
jgi:hypothetical protein